MLTLLTLRMLSLTTAPMPAPWVPIDDCLRPGIPIVCDNAAPSGTLSTPGGMVTASGEIVSDLEWTEGDMFETAMASVIAVNSTIMSLELDVPWYGWVYVENFLLVTYTFELAMRIQARLSIPGVRWKGSKISGLFIMDV